MSVRILTGDCRDVLAALPERSVQACVTSPPYWGLRDYGIEPTIWGGTGACEHEWGVPIITDTRGTQLGPKDITVDAREAARGALCRVCSAWRGCHGLEPSIELYVEHAVEIFRAVRRVLRDDGVLFLNLGDSYAGSWGAQGHRVTESDKPSWHSSQIKNHPKRASHTGAIRDAGLKPKDLCMIPARVALALQAGFARCNSCNLELRGDLWPVWSGHRICIACEQAGKRGTHVIQSECGWWLRSEIVWAKPNPMPESVTDRPTSSHEKIFLLSKSARYYYDADAVREKTDELCRRAHTFRNDSYIRGRKFDNSFVEPRDDTAIDGPLSHGRNLRNVWTFATEPFPEAHFATFPTELARRCILAGCPVGGTVLDPFAGSFTTCLVADRLVRNAIGIEAKAEYCELGRKRLAGDAPLFIQPDDAPAKHKQEALL
jgi:DNA modification methylase